MLDPDRIRRLQGAASEPKVSKQIGKYVILREVAHGAMGTVYEATDTELNRVVALKVLGKSSESTMGLERFRREALAVAALTHPNLVKLFDAGVEDGWAYIALEYLEGRSFRDVMRDPLEKKLAALLGAARGVAAAHERGIVHRDLKPENIVVTRDGVAKVVDFGLAQGTQEGQPITQSGVMIGTPQYMAPEQASGKTREIGPPTDVFSLGVMLYEILAERPPFVGDDLKELATQIVMFDPPPPSGARPLVAICMTALNKEPARRFPNAGEFADDLERYIGGHAVKSTLPSRRRRSMLPAIVGLVLLAVGISMLIRPTVESNPSAELESRTRVAMERLEDSRMGVAVQGRPLAEVEKVVKDVAARHPNSRVPKEWLAAARHLAGEPGGVTAIDYLAGCRIEPVMPQFENRPSPWSRIEERRFEATGAVADFLRGIALWNQQRFKEAAAALEVPVVRGWVPAITLAALSQLCDGAPRRAIDLLDRVPGTSPLIRGLALTRLGLYDEAEKVLEDNLAGLGYVCRMRAKLEKKDPSDALRRAVEAYDKAIAQAPTAANYTGRSMARLGAPAAVEDATRAVQLDPASPFALVARAMATLSLDSTAANLDSAIRDIEAAILLVNDVSLFHYNLAVAYRDRASLSGDQSMMDRAIESFTRAHQLAPEDGAILFYRGQAQMMRGDSRRAIADASEVITLDPQNGMAFALRGAAYLRLEEYELALQSLEKAFEINPKNSGALTNRAIACFRLGRAAADRNEDGSPFFRKAAADWTELLVRNPDHPMAHFNRGVNRQRLSLWPEAEADFREFVRRTPEDADGWAALGSVLERQGKTAEAAEAAAKAAELRRR